jgi:hypothetical protein
LDDIVPAVRVWYQEIFTGYHERQIRVEFVQESTAPLGTIVKLLVPSSEEILLVGLVVPVFHAIERTEKAVERLNDQISSIRYPF